MKWGKKKKQSFSSSSRPFLISHVLPTSWLTKFKQMGINSGHNDPKKQEGKWNSVPANSSSDAGNDAFWRLSFGEKEEKFPVFRSVRYNSDDADDLQFMPSSCQNCTLNAATRVNSKEDSRSYRFDMVAQVNKSRKFTGNREKVAEIRTPRLRVEKERKTSQRVYEEKQLKFEGRKDCCISPLNSRDPYLRKIKEITAENGSENFDEERFLSEWQKLKERKIKELKSRNEEKRKSLYISRELHGKTSKQNSKVRAYSPRAEICKIRALEDMKKAKLKMKKKAKEKTIEGFQGLESFAVAKYSYDPQNDFRESMIEMIEERKINKPEELEELLACYLTLNSDEYHDLIIRVFRQVWLDMNQACFESDTQLEK